MSIIYKRNEETGEIIPHYLTEKGAKPAIKTASQEKIIYNTIENLELVYIRDDFTNLIAPYFRTQAGILPATDYQSIGFNKDGYNQIQKKETITKYRWEMYVFSGWFGTFIEKAKRDKNYERLRDLNALAVKACFDNSQLDWVKRTLDKTPPEKQAAILNFNQDNYTNNIIIRYMYSENALAAAREEELKIAMEFEQNPFILYNSWYDITPTAEKIKKALEKELEKNPDFKRGGIIYDGMENDLFFDKKSPIDLFKTVQGIKIFPGINAKYPHIILKSDFLKGRMNIPEFLLPVNWLTQTPEAKKLINHIKRFFNNDPVAPTPFSTKKTPDPTSEQKKAIDDKSVITVIDLDDGMPDFLSDDSDASIISAGFSFSFEASIGFSIDFIKINNINTDSIGKIYPYINVSFGGNFEPTIPDLLIPVSFYMGSGKVKFNQNLISKLDQDAFLDWSCTAGSSFSTNGIIFTYAYVNGKTCLNNPPSAEHLFDTHLIVRNSTITAAIESTTNYTWALDGDILKGFKLEKPCLNKRK